MDPSFGYDACALQGCEMAVKVYSMNGPGHCCQEPTVQEEVLQDNN
jgi:hypothetical protein